MAEQEKKPRKKINFNRSPTRKKKASPKTSKTSNNSTNPGERPTPDYQEELNIERDVETLLEIRERKPLPPIPQRKGRKCVLYDIIQYNPDRYARLITHIRSGVSFNVAAEAAGIGERTFFEWGQKGQVDFDNNEDSYFSRFYKDVRRAVASATADCEIHVKEMEPKKWLAHGPGRIFGGAWSEGMSRGPNAPKQKQLEKHEDYIDAPFTVKSLPAPISPEKTNASPLLLQVSKDLEYEAFQVLENIGCITMSEEFKQAFNQQQSEDPTPTTIPEQIMEEEDA